MAASIGRVLCKTNHIFNDVGFLMKVVASPAYNCVPVLYMRSKPYDPKFREKRRDKILYYDKNVFEKNNDLKQKPRAEQRKEIKKKDPLALPERIVTNHRAQSELQSTTVFDPYIPPEGDGKSSVISRQGMGESYVRTKKAFESRIKSVRKIKKYEDNFSLKELAPELLNIYVEAHQILPEYKKNKGRFHELVTNVATEKMIHNIERVTMRWEYLGCVEPAKVVHVTCAEMFSKGIWMAQLTLRAHTKQKLAMYDQFGRLMYGNEDTEINVLDYLVFEKNIVDLFGRWRLHDKIEPEWRKEPVHVHRSMKLEKMEFR